MPAHVATFPADSATALIEIAHGKPKPESDGGGFEGGGPESIEANRPKVAWHGLQIHSFGVSASFADDHPVLLTAEQVKEIGERLNEIMSEFHTATGRAHDYPFPADRTGARIDWAKWDRFYFAELLRR